MNRSTIDQLIINSPKNERITGATGNPVCLRSRTADVREKADIPACHDFSGTPFAAPAGKEQASQKRRLPWKEDGF
jgi:hypothetical protein